MINQLNALLVGFIFALGLNISGMTQPKKIQGFLDIFGQWDPSLIFVMIGAIGVHFFTYKLIRKRQSPLFSVQWHVPQKSEITKNLIFGAVIFGFGWGLAGFCPGPALASLGSVTLTPWIFFISMIAGMFLFKVIDKKFKINR